MSYQKCIVTNKKNIVRNNKCDVYYIEDYMGFEDIRKANILTNEIFSNNQEFIKKYDYNGYKVTWSWYDLVYAFSLKCTELESLVSLIKVKKYNNIELIDISVAHSKVFKKYFFNKNIIEKNTFKATGKIKEFITNTVLAFFYTYFLYLFFN